MKDDKTIVGTYTYDAWGKITNLGSLTAIAQVNPFRYRGYYYDTESGLYYLNSRYYNPDWGRFINTDTLLSMTDKISNMNLFSYAGCNPVNYYDTSGFFTIGICGELNLTVMFGISVGMSLNFDGNGNIALQYSYSFPSNSEIISAGCISGGASLQLMMTNLDSVYDLNGIGQSGGFAVSIPGHKYLSAVLDVIFSDIDDDLSGVKLGIGISPILLPDAHISQSKTSNSFCINPKQVVNKMHKLESKINRINKFFGDIYAI